MPGGVALECVVGGGDAVKRPAGHFRARAIVDADRLRGADLQPLGDEGAVRFGDDEPHSWVRRAQGQQRFGIEMIGVIVRGRDDGDAGEFLRCNDALGQAHVRLVRLRVFARERIGKIRIEQQKIAGVADEKPALAEPPDAQFVGLGVRPREVGEEGFVMGEWADHRSTVRCAMSKCRMGMRRMPAYRGHLAHRMENIREALTTAQAQWRAGNAAEAAAIYQRVLDCTPDDATALHQLGVIAQQRGQSHAAEDLLRRAAEAAPGSDLVLNNLGVVLEARGKFADAAACYERAIALNPNRARVHFNRANALRALGHWSEAEASFRRALELDPRDVDALHNLAALHKERGDREQAEALFRQVLTLAPGMLDAHVNLGSVLQGLGRDDEALACFREALRLQPGFPDAVAGEAGWLERHGDIEEAGRRLMPLLETARDNPDVATTFATLAPRLGRETEAVEMLERVLDDPTLLASKRQAALFALGKLFDKLGRYEDAFRHYQQANELRPRVFDFGQFVSFSERVLAVLDASFLATAPRAMHSSELPVFVVGMPRSGTSLVEQILASHPKVFGAGELPAIECLAESLPQLCETTEEYPECLRAANPATFDAAAGKYLAQLRALGPEAQRVVDKMPGNFLHIGLIELLFPKARVIHIQRDPLDNCLSCYFQNFNQGHEYSYDLAMLGRVYRQYERIMEHWRNVTRVPLLEIRYEDLVARQEEETRRLLEFCGLDWDQRCLRFHEMRRVVRTASYDQVRRPIYRHSVERYRNYYAWLDPLREALARPVPVAESGFPPREIVR